MLVRDVTAGRVWLADVLSGQQSVPFSGSAPPTAELIAEARSQDVVALVSRRLQQAQQRDFANPANLSHSVIAQAFAAVARDDALTSMLLEAESRRVLGLMEDAGISGLLLKGSALAHWAYSQPHLRACGDVDFLLESREAAEQLSVRLTTSGYDRAETSGELVAYELLCTRAVTSDWRLEIDIHWRLCNSPLFSDAFTFDELMADSIPLPRLAPNARGLGPVHALLHACVHRALNLSIGVDDKLKWLYDLIVLMDVFTPADWQRVMHISIDKRLAGVVLSGLETAATTFQHELPADILATLKQAAAFEPLDAQRLSDWHYMQRKTFEALPTMSLRLRWLWQRVFPSRDYLSYLYGSEHQSYAALMAERFRRAMRRVRN